MLRRGSATIGFMWRGMPAVLRSVLPVVALLALIAAPVAAQHRVSDVGGRVYGLVGGGFGDGTFVATGAGAGLRLTRHLGLDVDLIHLPGAEASGMPAWFGGASASPAAFLTGALSDGFPSFPGGFDPLFPFIRIEDARRDVTAFLTRFTVEFPVANGRLFPYLTGGGGVGRVTERFNVVVDPIPWFPFGPPSVPSVEHAPDGINGAHFFGRSLLASPTEHAEIGLSLVLGGGIDVRLWRGLGLGVDVRWLRILRSFDALDTAQVASRVSYRF